MNFTYFTYRNWIFSIWANIIMNLWDVFTSWYSISYTKVAVEFNPIVGDHGMFTWNSFIIKCFGVWLMIFMEFCVLQICRDNYGDVLLFKRLASMTRINYGVSLVLLAVGVHNLCLSL